MYSSLSVIVADTSHAEIISRIGHSAFRKAFEYLFNSREELQQYLDHTYNIDKLVASIGKETNIYFLAVLDRQVVGFAKLKKHSLNQQIDSFAQTELQKIYVLFEHHGSGAGNALLEACIDLAREVQAEQLWLDTHIANARGIRFYELHGFKKHAKYFFTIGTQQFEYDLMTLEIIQKLKGKSQKSKFRIFQFLIFNF